MTDETARDFDFLERAGLILMAFQIAIYASLWMTGGLLRSSDGYFLLVTALFVANQRKILRSPPNRGAASWVFASRVAVLAVIALGTLVVAAVRNVCGGRGGRRERRRADRGHGDRRHGWVRACPELWQGSDRIGALHS
jgi:hypothetical protein